MLSTVLATAPLTPGLVKSILSTDQTFAGAEIEICYNAAALSCETIDRTGDSTEGKTLAKQSQDAQLEANALAQPLHRLAVHFKKSRYFGLQKESAGFSRFPSWDHL